MKEIIKCKADLNAEDKNRRTALLLACLYRQQESVQVLLEAGSNPNIADNDGHTSLYVAAGTFCRKKIIKAIIDRGADVNRTNKNNATALMIACEKRHVDAIHVLLKARSDTNIVCKDGCTCLMIAVYEHCSDEVLQAIIDHGADVNATSKNSATALMIAYEKRYVGAIRILLKAESDTNIVRKDGCTCLMIAVYEHCSDEVLQAIIDHGADLNATSKNNATALIIACEKRHVDAIHVLLKAGSDTNIVRKDGCACLMIAVYEHCSDEVLQAIIDHGTDVNAINKHSATALMSACVKRHVDAIHVLLKAGSDTNIADNNGNTCFMHAINADCSNEVLQALIDHGANANVMNNMNVTPLMMSRINGNGDAINLLLSDRADPNGAAGSTRRFLVIFFCFLFGFFILFIVFCFL